MIPWGHNGKAGFEPTISSQVTQTQDLGAKELLTQPNGNEAKTMNPKIFLRQQLF